MDGDRGHELIDVSRSSMYITGFRLSPSDLMTSHSLCFIMFSFFMDMVCAISVGYLRSAVGQLITRSA